MLCFGNCSRRVKTNRMFSAFKLTSIQQYPVEFCTSYAPLLNEKNFHFPQNTIQSTIITQKICSITFDIIGCFLSVLLPSTLDL